MKPTTARFALLALALFLVACNGGDKRGSEGPPDGTPPDASQPSSPDIKTISTGEEVALADHLASGKYTVVEFSADW